MEPTDPSFHLPGTYRAIQRGGLRFEHVLNDGVEAREDSRLLWSDSFQDAPPAPDFSATRRISTTLTRTLWGDQAGETIVGLCADGVGVRVTAWEGRTGVRRWSRLIPPSPPALFTDPSPPPGNCAEEMYGFLAAETELPVLCVQRTSRCSIALNADEDSEAALKLPEFAASLELAGLDAATGATRWESGHPDIHVGVLERDSFDGLYSTPRSVGIIDWGTGSARVLLETPRAMAAWPRRRGGDVACAYHCRGQLHTALVDLATGRRHISHAIRVVARHSIDLYLTGDLGIVNLDAQTYVPLSRDLKPTAIVKARGWFRGLSVHESGAMELWTSMGSTLIDPKSGSILKSSRF